MFYVFSGDEATLYPIQSGDITSNPTVSIIHPTIAIHISTPVATYSTPLATPDSIPNDAFEKNKWICDICKLIFGVFLCDCMFIW